jgi:hypothetical protein
VNVRICYRCLYKVASCFKISDVKLHASHLCFKTSPSADDLVKGRNILEGK